MKVFQAYTTKSPTITLHLHGKNMTIINGSLFSLLQFPINLLSYHLPVRKHELVTELKIKK